MNTTDNLPAYHLRARPWPVPQPPTPWYASICRKCGWTSPPAASPDRAPDRCPVCAEA